MVKKCELCSSKFFTYLYLQKKGYGKYCSHPCYAKSKDNGRTILGQKIRQSKGGKKWRLSVFQRDDFTCQECSSRGRKDTQGEIQADHIKPLSVILSEQEIKTFEQALQCEEIWDTNNGRTLCRPCHKLTPTFGKKL